MTESNPTPPPQPVDYSTEQKSGLFTPPPAPAEAVTDKDARLWGMLCHLSALVQFVGVPSILGRLIVWLIKKNEIPFANDQGKEAVNFHLTVIIVALVLSPTVCIGIGIFLIIGIAIAGVVFSIIGAVKANSGVWYRYPFALRLIK